MNTLLLLLPILFPLVTAMVGLLAWERRQVQRSAGVIGMAGLLASGIALLITVWNHGVLAAQIGGWPAPFGITLVADLLSAIMVTLGGLMGLAVTIYSTFSMDEARERYGYYTLLAVLMMGVTGAFLTGDVFSLYVWFEVMLIASFVLIGFGGERAQLEGAIKYVTLNLVSSAIFLAAAGLLYRAAGTLNMADLAVRLPELDSGLTVTLSMMFLIAFGIKAGLFPLFFWLPASYHTPPLAISAIFAGLLTKVGVYALLRTFSLIFVADIAYTHNLLLLIVAGLTMFIGVLGAASQGEWRRILSFHIISQIGYMIMGLALFTPLALAGAIFYIIHHIVVKTNLFLVGGIVHRIQGTYDLKKLGGLYRHYPLLALLFLIPALSLAGIPPLSGFWAKFTLIRAGLEAEGYLIVTTALVVSLLTLYSMTKIWAEAFWKSPATALPASSDSWWPLAVPVTFLALVTVGISFAAEPVMVLSLTAAEQLLDPAAYIAAVLGALT